MSAVAPPRRTQRSPSGFGVARRAGGKLTTDRTDATDGLCVHSEARAELLTANPEESGFDLNPKLRGSLTTDDRMTGWALIPNAGANFYPDHPVKTPSFALAQRPGAQINRRKRPVLRSSTAPVLSNPAENGDGGRKRSGQHRSLTPKG